MRFFQKRTLTEKQVYTQRYYLFEGRRELSESIEIIKDEVIRAHKMGRRLAVLATLLKLKERMILKGKNDTKIVQMMEMQLKN